MSENANIGRVFNLTGGGERNSSLKLLSISVKTAPTKTIYKSGETFDPTGMVIEADYGNGIKAEATGYNVSPSVLTDGVTSVTITFTEGRITKTTTLSVTVQKVLTSISVTVNPSKMEYGYLESFSPAGMTVTAVFSDGSSSPVTGYTYTTSAFTQLGTNSVTIGYTYRGSTKTTSLSVNVVAMEVAIPAQSGTLVYNGSTRIPNWNSAYDSSKMTIGGDTSAANAGTYQVTFTLAYGYVFTNGTSVATVNWTIDRATIASLPTQSNALVADGTQKVPEWNGYVVDLMTMSGDLYGVAAGSYTTTFTPTSNYKWWDNTTGAKNATWTIESILVSIPFQNGTLTYDGTNKTPAWSNFDSENSSVSVTGQTNAGTYNATFSLLRGKWSDGTTSNKTIPWTIEKATISAVPAQSGTLKYNGNPKTPTWNAAYDSSKMTLSVESKTLAGTYSASFTPAANYKWWDGTTGAKSATWVISKADDTLTLSPTSVTLNMSNMTASIFVNCLGNGTISAISSNTSVVTVESINQTTGEIVVQSVNNTSGIATIAVSVAESDNYNAPSSKTASITASFREYLYGYDLALTDSNPNTRVSYPNDVDNSGFNKASMGSSTFSYGSWPSEVGTKFMPRPCMLKFDGTVDYYLNPNDYTKKADGSASDVANMNYGGNAMMEWPKIYTKRWEANDIYHFRCSDVKIDNDYECWCNYDKNNNEIDHFYTPIYFGSKDTSNRLRSISGQDNSIDTTATEEITYAKNNGANNWFTEVVADRFLEQDLLVMMFKSTDLQTALGNGVVGDLDPEYGYFIDAPIINTGTMNNKGMFWGDTSNTTAGVKAFGMENLWGNLGRRTAGWGYKDGIQYLKLTRGTKDGTSVSDYNTDGTGYLQVSATIALSGYISAMQTQRYGRLPLTTSGSYTTYEADYVFRGAVQSNYYYAWVGGTCNVDSRAGPFYVQLYFQTSFAGNCGAALSCKPLAST